MNLHMSTISETVLRPVVLMDGGLRLWISHRSNNAIERINDPSQELTGVFLVCQL